MMVIPNKRERNSKSRATLLYFILLSFILFFLAGSQTCVLNSMLSRPTQKYEMKPRKKNPLGQKLNAIKLNLNYHRINIMLHE